MTPGREIVLTGVPRYAEVKEKGSGPSFDPAGRAESASLTIRKGFKGAGREPTAFPTA